MSGNCRRRRVVRFLHWLPEVLRCGRELLLRKMPQDARLALFEGSRTAVSEYGAIQALWRGLPIYAPQQKNPTIPAVGWCHRAAQAFGCIGGCFVSILPCLLSGLTGCKRNRLADRIAFALPAEARHTLAEWAVLEKSMRWRS